MTPLAADVVDQVRCPICRSPMRTAAERWQCVQASHEFPVIRGVPILINEANSVFRLGDFAHAPPQLLETDRASILSRLKRLVPDVGHNAAAAPNFRRLRALLEHRPDARVLIVGGGVLGRGIEELLAAPGVVFVETDVWIGPRTRLVCDAHDMPFADRIFDAVVAQAVLEHVADPARVVAEMRRVLKADGYVYAETPFMQQVHLGAYDFTRFTLLGHRRLFRGFDEIDAGAVSGPGIALIWAYENFLLALVRSTTARNLVKAFARTTAFFLRFADAPLRNRPAGLDAASAFYFLGRRSEHELTDRELIACYRGAQQHVGAAAPEA